MSQQKTEIKQQSKQQSKKMEDQSINNDQKMQKPKKNKPNAAKDDEKSNTNAWQLKQQQKKKLKQQGQENVVNEKKQKKQKKKQKEQKLQQVKNQEGTKQTQQIQQIQALPKVYYPLSTITDQSTAIHLIGDKRSQQNIMFNNMAQFISPSDTILYIGKGKWNPGCEKVSISQFAECESAQLICKYKDAAYFFEGEITKIFCQASVIFDNGSALVKKGVLSLIMMAKEAKAQVIVNSCSWNYCGYKALNQDDLERKYGESILEKYDWVAPKWVDLIVMEVGGMQPSQVGTQVRHRYKNFAVDKLKW